MAMQQDQDQAQILPLAGFPIRSMSASALSNLLQERLGSPRQTALLIANTNLILQCQPLREWICSDNVVLVNDGIGLDIAALLMHQQRYQVNLNGTDFLPYFLTGLRSPRKIFLYGGKPGVADKAAGVIKQKFGQEVVGHMDGYTAIAPAALCEAINCSGAEIVLVAMGNPLQEEWIRKHMGLLDAKLFVGVGALFDFLSGGVKRAPLWVQKIRFEWLYRLLQEPKRLAKRYTLDIVKFLYVCFRYKK